MIDHTQKNADTEKNIWFIWMWGHYRSASKIKHSDKIFSVFVLQTCLHVTLVHVCMSKPRQQGDMYTCLHEQLNTQWSVYFMAYQT